MWLLSAGFTLLATLLVVCRRPLVIVAALGWLLLTLNQLTYIGASTARLVVYQVCAAAVLALIVPLLAWAGLEWKKPQEGLYRLVLASGPTNPSKRIFAAVLIGCLLAGGPAYVLQALGLRLWPVAMLVTGVLLALLFGNRLHRKSGSLTSA